MSSLVKLIVLETDCSVVRAIDAAAEGQFQVLKTSDPRRAAAWLASESPIAAVAANESLSAPAGLDLLAEAQCRCPTARRILLTPLSDLATIVRGLHSGAVQFIVQKPLRGRELERAMCPEAPLKH